MSVHHPLRRASDLRIETVDVRNGARSQETASLRGWAEEAAPLVEQYRSVSGTPGIAVGLVEADGRMLSLCGGFSDVAVGSQVIAQTRFQIGSVSKTFVALAVFRSVQQGLCRLEDNALAILPQLDTGDVPALTLGRLLRHTSGLRCGTGYSRGSDQEVRDAIAALQAFPELAPNGTFYYSNLGYDLLGHVLRALHGKPLASVLADEVFGPLGLSATACRGTDVPPDAATGYWGAVRGMPRLRTDPVVPATDEHDFGASGCVVSSLLDLGRLCVLLMNHGQPLLDERAAAQLVAPGEDDESGWSYGNGLLVRDRDGRLHLGHTGGLTGFRSAFAVDVRAGRGAVILSNMGTDHHAPAIWRLVRMLVGALVPASHDGVSRLTPVLDPAAAGRYRCSDGGPPDRNATLVTGHRSRAYVVFGEQKAPLELFEPDRAIVADADFRSFELRLVRNSAGAIIGFEHGPSWFDRDDDSAISGTGDHVPAAPLPSSGLAGLYGSESPSLPMMRIVLVRGAWRLHIEDMVFDLTALPSAASDEAVRYQLRGTPEVLELPFGADGAVASLSGCFFHRLAPRDCAAPPPADHAATAASLQ